MHAIQTDPEARPSARQLLECAKALLTGAPLPFIEVPEEARIRRQERIENEQRRAQIIAARKKAAQQPLQRPQGPLDASSVAARRLAAKRGQAVDGGLAPVSQRDFGSPTPSSAAKSGNPFGGDSGFGSAGAGNDFFGAGSTSSSTAEDLFFSSDSAHTDLHVQEGKVSASSSDFFGSGSNIHSSQTTSNSDFDPFSTTVTSAAFPSSSVGTSHSDGFSSAGSNFDPFDSSSSLPAPSANAGFDPFASPTAPVHHSQNFDSFDPFSSSPASAVAPAPVSLKQPSRDANDFDFFAGSAGAVTKTEKSHQSSLLSDFESFGVQPKQNEKSLNSVLSLFDASPAMNISTIPTAGPMSGAPRAVMMVNPAFGMGGGGMAGGMYPMGGMGMGGAGAPIMTTRPSVPQPLPSPVSHDKRSGGSDPFGSLNVFGK